MDSLVLLIDLFATFRLVRLVVKDSLLNGPRWWILNRWPSELTEFPDAIVTSTPNGNGVLESGVVVFRSNREDSDGDPLWLPLKTHKITELIECSWCASMYVAAAVLALREWWDWWQWPALALALSALVGLIFKRWDTD